jgi:hypothetical protein
MSGHKRKLPRLTGMSGLPPKADIGRKDRHVRLVPLQATIRSSCVHGGLYSIDLDQELADILGSHIRLEAGHGYEGAADSRACGR